MWYTNIAGRFFELVTKHACGRQTDGQNYDSQDRASTASRGKNGDAQKKRPGREVRGVSPETGMESMVGMICAVRQLSSPRHR